METKEYVAIRTKINKEKSNFLKSMRITVLIGQFFGLMPVLGICEEDASKLRFTCYSGRFLYSVMTAIAQGITMIFFAIKVAQESSDLASYSTGLNFFVSTWIESILFLKLAKDWPKLCRQIAKIESIDPTCDKYLVWKCNITCIAILLLAAVENCFSNIIGLSNAMACHPDQNLFEADIKDDFEFIWSYVTYSKISACVVKFVNVQSTFNWTYSGIFIMCISWYLVTRLQQINDRIYAAKGQTLPPNFWRTVREDFTKATSLVKQVDQVINSITFVSFSSNLYSVCLLILNSIEYRTKRPLVCGVIPEERLLRGYENVAYYMFSISFLIVRSLGVSLLAARVNSTSAETAFALYDIPSKDFDFEVQRLIDQIHGDSVALTGLKLFYVKRNIVLTIAAAIVTYELVLIQFNRR